MLQQRQSVHTCERIVSVCLLKHHTWRLWRPVSLVMLIFVQIQVRTESVFIFNLVFWHRAIPNALNVIKTVDSLKLVPLSSHFHNFFFPCLYSGIVSSDSTLHPEIQYIYVLQMYNVTFRNLITSPTVRLKELRTELQFTDTSPGLTPRLFLCISSPKPILNNSIFSNLFLIPKYTLQKSNCQICW